MQELSISFVSALTLVEQTLVVEHRKTASAAAEAGVTVAAGAAGTVTTAAGHVGGTAAQVGGTAMRAVSGRRGHSPKRGGTNDREMGIFCNDLYTEEFILGEIEKVRKNKNIINLLIEDLIVRENQNLAEAMIQLILDTAAPIDYEASPGSKGAKNDFSRIYESITFVDCVSSSSEYKKYAEGKKVLQKQLQGKEKIRECAPMRFKAKVELHTMLTGDEVKGVLRDIENDETVTGIDFPQFTREQKKVPKLFVQNFDVEAGEWTADAMSIEIQLRYADQDNLGHILLEEPAFMPRKKYPRRLMTAILRRLEGRTDEEIPGGSMRTKKKKSPPKKTVSDGGSPPKRKSGSPGKKTVPLGPDGKPLKRKPLKKCVSADGSAVPKTTLRKATSMGGIDEGSPKRGSRGSPKTAVKKTTLRKATSVGGIDEGSPIKRGSRGSPKKRSSEGTFEGSDGTIGSDEDSFTSNNDSEGNVQVTMNSSSARGRQRNRAPLTQ